MLWFGSAEVPHLQRSLAVHSCSCTKMGPKVLSVFLRGLLHPWHQAVSSSSDLTSSRWDLRTLCVNLLHDPCAALYNAAWPVCWHSHRQPRKFLITSSQRWIGKKALQHSLMEIGSCETLTWPDSLFLFLCLQPFSPLKEKTIDMLDVSGNSFVILMTAYFSL